MVTFLLKHHLTDATLTDLLSILNLFIPNTFPPSKYMFYKAIQVDNTQVSKPFKFLSISSLVLTAVIFFFFVMHKHVTVLLTANQYQSNPDIDGLIFILCVLCNENYPII